MGILNTALSWLRKYQNISSSELTYYKSDDTGSTGVGGPRYDSFYSTNSYIEWIASCHPYYYTDELLLVDGYNIESCTLSLTVGSRGLMAGVEVVAAPEHPGALTAAQRFEYIKSADIIAVTGEAQVSGAIISIPITDLSVVRSLITNGIGFRRVYDAWGTITALSMAITYGMPLYDADITITYPSNTVIVSNNSNTFTWSITGSIKTQSHYDLQYSDDSGETWTTFADKVESTVLSCTIPGDTFTSGSYLWRVRAYTDAGETVSNWVQAAFTVQTNASTTGVTCDDKPMPTITWTASEQIAYQVKMGSYDSGTVYSATGSHRPAKYFANGTYALTVRTQTASGVWSAWTTVLYIGITNVPGDNILLSAYQDGYGAGLRWTTAGTYTDYYILRDGIPIAVTTGNTYTDTYANGPHVYTVLAPLAGGYYTLSNESTQSVSLPWDIISTVDTLSWLPLKHALNNLVSRSYSESDTVTYRYFAGREYPVAFRAGQKAKKASLRYGFKTADEVEEIYSLVGAIVIFKDRRGNRVIGMIDGFSRTVGKYYDISMSITQIDYNEEVLYDTEYPAS